jgi:hypothetical protein
MTYLLFAVSIIQLAVLVYVLRDASRAREAAEARHADERAQLLDRIQAPSVAAAQSLTERAGAVDVSQPTYVSAFDDEQWQEYEAKRAQLESETSALVDEFLKDSPHE